MHLKLAEKKLKKLNNTTLSEENEQNLKYMNICFASSNIYIPHLCAALKSIFSNKKANEEFNITIFENDISDRNKKYISSLIGQPSTVKFIHINEETLKNICPITEEISHINSLKTYYRLLVSDFIEADKVLFLDCDVIIKQSLSSLYDTDIENYYIAGVRDSYERENCARLNISKYVNAGILLINLKMWKENKITTKLLNWCCENYKKIIWAEQDVINVVLQNKIKYLEDIYNAQVSELEFGLTGEFNKIATNAVIIHYVGHRKPWLNNRFTLSWYYYKYLLKTKFAYKFFLLLLSEIFSIKKELSGKKEYLAIRLCGLRIKIRKERI